MPDTHPNFRPGMTWVDAVAQYKTEKMSNQTLFRAYQRLAQSPIARSFDESREAVLITCNGRPTAGSQTALTTW
ncbi:hypothetical protein [Pseudomonas sp. ZS1P83]